jgi:hypothetical protein
MVCAEKSRRRKSAAPADDYKIYLETEGVKGELRHLPKPGILLDMPARPDKRIKHAGSASPAGCQSHGAALIHALLFRR